MVFISTFRALSLQTIKYQMRVPSIKFRKGGIQSTSETPNQSAPLQQHSQAAQTQATVEFYELPARYKTKPLSEEEIDYINRGGPA